MNIVVKNLSSFSLELKRFWMFQKHHTIFLCIFQKLHKSYKSNTKKQNYRMFQIGQVCLRTHAVVF